jgi:hypothetical protein
MIANATYQGETVVVVELFESPVNAGTVEVQIVFDGPRWVKLTDLNNVQWVVN